jgi:hypothetical protein
MRAPFLPDIARSLLKGLIVSMASAGVITSADAEHLIGVLDLRDA